MQNDFDVTNISRILNKLTDEQKQKIRDKLKRNQEILNNPSLNNKVLKKIEAKRIFDESLMGEDDESVVSLDRYHFPHNDRNAAEIRESHWETIQSYKDEVLNETAPNLIMFGAAGTGKTYLAKSLMFQLMKEGSKVIFLNALSLKKLAYQFNDKQAQAKLNRIERCVNVADLLILDDLGTESNGQSLTTTKEASQTIQSLIYELANLRTNKATLITTNLDLDGLKDIYQEQVISRLIPKEIDYVLNFNALDDLRNRGI